jgi:hypothetical protein
MKRTAPPGYWQAAVVVAVIIGFIVAVMAFELWLPDSPWRVFASVILAIAAALAVIAALTLQNAAMKESESDIDKLIATATSETETHVFHTTDTVLVDETVGVTDEVRAVLKREAEQADRLGRLKREGAQAKESRKKSSSVDDMDPPFSQAYSSSSLQPSAQCLSS